MSLSISFGLPEQQRSAAATLYWQAFGDKLQPILGPAPRACAHFERVMQLDHCFAAQRGTALVGIIGFQSGKGNFAGGSAQQFRASFGKARALWSLPVLQWIGGPPPAKGALMIDGFSVAPAERGKGIGSALLAKLREHAKLSGFDALQLDVTGNNPRARAFYERGGFYVQSVRTIGPLSMVMGFGHVLRMRCDLPRDQGSIGPNFGSRP